MDNLISILLLLIASTILGTIIYVGLQRLGEWADGNTEDS